MPNMLSSWDKVIIIIIIKSNLKILGYLPCLRKTDFRIIRHILGQSNYYILIR